ncbi:FG-GAP-like repeat-containing protein [Myxococcota bacterium]|nr:FG-GAP-like repeat-containing protein [Myxococcota bacterium]
MVDQEGALDAGLFYDDRDGDGWGDEAAWWHTCQAPAGTVTRAGDCDDGEASISPDQDEVCDGLDNDCDGLWDEADAVDAPRWYLDADGDLWGQDAVYQDACAQPDGYVEGGGDCHDGDAQVNPGMAELCDPGDVDEDCSGLADDLDPAADGLTSWHLDGDGDGFGRDDDVVESCEPQAGRAERGGDCDDADPRVHPDADEVCANGTDDDCDGLADDRDPDPGPDVALYADADGDGYGDPAQPRGAGCALDDGLSSQGSDCDDTAPDVHPGAAETWYDGVDQDCAGDDDDDADGDGAAAAEAGGPDCDDGDDEVWPGATEVCADGVDQDCDGRVDPCAPLVFEGTAGARAGGAVAGVGDVDGDGWPDLLVGGALHGDANAGAAWLLRGPAAEGAGTWDGEALALTGDEDAGHAGAAVAGPGDVDGDGYADLLVGAPGADLGGGAGSGGAWLLPGPVPAEGLLAELAGAVLVGEDADDQAGSALAGVGDVDGDGWPDLVIGAAQADPFGSRTGAAWLLRGPLEGEIDLWDADGTWAGADAGDQAGAAVAGAGDVDGDGLMDVLVGAPYLRGDDHWAGGAFLVAGPATGSHDLSDATALLRGALTSDQAGAAVAGAGDVDGDGHDDVLVGAPGYDGGGAGSGGAFLLRGPLAGTVALASADLVLIGATAEDAAGSSVAGALDLDGDGTVDLAVGARLDDAGATDAGALYLVLSPGSGSMDLGAADLRVQGGEGDLEVGGALAAPGDVDGDGRDELLLGVPGADQAWLLGG